MATFKNFKKELKELNKELAIVDAVSRVHEKVDHLKELDRNEYDESVISMYVNIIIVKLKGLWLCNTKEEVISFEEKYINCYYEKALEEARLNNTVDKEETTMAQETTNNVTVNEAAAQEEKHVYEYSYLNSRAQRKLFDAMMTNENYHMVFDGTTPAGKIKFRRTTGEEVIVAIPDDVEDEEMEEITMAQNTQNVTINEAPVEEEITMNENTNTVATNDTVAEAENTTTEKKEDKVMTREQKRAERKARFEQYCKAEGDKAEARCRKIGEVVGTGTGVAVGFVESGAKDVASKIGNSRYIKATREGYVEKFAISRETGHQLYAKANDAVANGQAKKAANELFNKFFKKANDDAECGDGVWNGTTAQ